MEPSQNIVLIGMPGSGKTTVGTLLAQALHRNLVDMDQAIVEEQGNTISYIFAQQGEEAFRQMETAKAKELGQQTGLVISTGGGVVTRTENMEALSANGVLCFLDRPLEHILVEKENGIRPLLTQDREAKLRRLYKDRISLYEKYSHVRILNDSTPEKAVEKLLEKIKETGGYAL